MPIQSHKRLLFDGSMGALLASRGHFTSGCPEMLNLEKPEAICQVHADYAAAGADILKTNSFGANRLKLAGFSLENRAGELAAAAVGVARRGGGGKPVALSVGPTGVVLQPGCPTTALDLIEVFAEPIRAAAQAGADLILIETMLDMAEARAAMLAARREAPGLPIAVSYTLEGSRTLMGNPTDVLATVAARLGASFVGLNCSGGPGELLSPFTALAQASPIPVMAMPNAGIPEIIDGKTTFPMGPQAFASAMPPFMEAGACAVGGCCGTTPQHIALLRQLVDAAGDKPSPLPQPDRICSARAALPLETARRQALSLALESDMSVDDAIDLILDETPGADAVLLDVSAAGDEVILPLLAEMPSYCAAPLMFSVRDDAQAARVLAAYAGIAAVQGPVSPNTLQQYGAYAL
nr:homocysteine S-methyltransferase family protein [bacterium]